MEEKKKKAATKTTKGKQTTRSRNNPKKKVAGKGTKTVTKAAKTSGTKKVAAKSTTKKVVAKAPVKKEVTKKIEVKEEKELKLEKTLVFDGKEKQNIDDVVKELEKEKVVVEDQVIDRRKSNKSVIWVLALLILTTIILSTLFVIKEMNKSKKSSEVNNNIYELVNSNPNSNSSSEVAKIDEPTYDRIKTISLKEFETKVLEKEDMNVIVSSSTCYYCLAFEPVLQEVLEDLNKTFYRINIYTMSTDDVNTFRKYYAFTKTPTIFIVKDGYVESELIGGRDKDTMLEWAKDNLV